MIQKRLVFQLIETIYELKYSYAKEVVAHVLFASKRKKVIHNQLDQCSTYGYFLSEPISYNETIALINNMIQQGLLVENRINQHHFITVSLLGARLFIKEDDLSTYQLLERDITESSTQHALYQLRKRVADESHVNPFVLFNNELLETIDLLQPKTKKEFLAIKGLEESDWEQFGQPICHLFSTEGQEVLINQDNDFKQKKKSP